LQDLPKGTKEGDYANWLVAPEDEESRLKRRFSYYEKTKMMLKATYGIRTPTEKTGIFHSIKSEGVGSETVSELIKGHLSRPIPIQFE
jgi:hypothetical protein